MTDPRSSVELDLLADYLTLISAKLAANYDKSRGGDYLLTDELSRLLVDCDKLVIGIRACAKLAVMGKAKGFSDQEKHVLDMFEQSIRQRNVVPFSQKTVDDAIGYLDDEDGDAS